VDKEGSFNGGIWTHCNTHCNTNACATVRLAVCLFMLMCRVFSESWCAWLRLVGSLQLWVSFTKEPYQHIYIPQKRPIIKETTNRSHPLCLYADLVIYVLITHLTRNWECKFAREDADLPLPPLSERKNKKGKNRKTNESKYKVELM